MKKTLFTALALFLLVGVAIVLPLSSAHALSTFVAETETKIYIPAKSYGGYFLPTQGIPSPAARRDAATRCAA
jgi:hypothetical protein